METVSAQEYQSVFSELQSLKEKSVQTVMNREGEHAREREREIDDKKSILCEENI